MKVVDGGGDPLETLEAVESGETNPLELVISLTVAELRSVRPDLTYEILAAGGIRPDDDVLIYQGSLIPHARA